MFQRMRMTLKLSSLTGAALMASLGLLDTHLLRDAEQREAAKPQQRER